MALRYDDSTINIVMELLLLINLYDIMQWSAIVSFVKDEKMTNHCVENMTSLTKNIELQGGFRNGCQII